MFTAFLHKFHIFVYFCNFIVDWSWLVSFPANVILFLLFLMSVIQLIYSSSVEAYLLWKCCSHVLTSVLTSCYCKPSVENVLLLMCCKCVIISHELHGRFYLWCQTNVTGISGNLCNKYPKWLIEQNSSYSDYFNAISGFTSNSRAPGGPVTFWHPIWDQRLPKLLKLSYCSLTAKCDILPKMCKNVQSQIMTKTALSGVSQQSSS